ncbi:MAG: hypothetical protein WCF19_06850 [Chlamydiales bacterium]
MSPRQAFASALHLFVVLAFFTAGLFFVALPYLPETRVQIIDLLSNRFETCTTVGLALFLGALLFLLGFYSLNRGRYLVIQMGTWTDIKIIRQTVEECLLKQFPRKISLKEIEIGPKSLLEMKVCLAPLDEAVREQLFVEVEKQLGVLLQQRFGYVKPFRLIVQV